MRKFISILFAVVLVLSFSLVMAVPAAANGTTWYVDDSAAAGGDGTTSDLTGANCAFDTIQEGINAASDGDTVSVAAGDYDENLSLTKEITLTGADAATTTIQGTIEVSNAGGGATVIENFTIDTDTGAETMGVNFSGASTSDVTIQDCIFEYDDGDNAIRANFDSTLTNIIIGTSGHGNTFTDKSTATRGNAISIDGDAGGVKFTDLDISYNTFTQTATGWGIIIEAANGVGDSTGLTITNNTFSTAGVLAVILLDNDGGASGIASGVQISNNNFADNGYAGYGIYLYNITDVSDHLPTAIDISTGGLNTFNATKSVSGAACIGDLASATHLYPTIQGAVTAATASDTVNVYPGTYTEAGEVTISDDNLTLKGVTAAGANDWTVGTAGAGGGVVVELSGAGHTLRAGTGTTGVTVQGLHLDTTGAETIGMNVGGTTSATVQYCSFTVDSADVAISLTDALATSVTVDYCAFLAGDGGQNWFTIKDGGGCTGTNTISNNTIAGMVSQLQLSTSGGNIYDITYSNNTFTNVADGILLQEFSEGTGLFGDIVVEYNTFATGGTADFYFMVFSNVEDADFEGGSFSADDITVRYNSFGLPAAGTYEAVSFDVPTPSASLNAEKNWWGGVAGPDIATNPYVAHAGANADVSANVDYLPWLIRNTLVANEWNIYSTPIALDSSCDTLAEALAIWGSSHVDGAWYYDSSASPQVWVIASSLTPLQAVYLHTTAADTIDVWFSSTYTAPPSRVMYQGWNLVGPAQLYSMYVEDALLSAYYGTSSTQTVDGYSQAISPAVNQTYWTYLRGGTPDTHSVIPTNGYWVYMVNQGTLGGFTYTPITELP